MKKSFVFLAFSVAVAASLSLKNANASDIFGMMQLSRSDGMTSFYLLGKFGEKRSCFNELELLSDNFIESSGGAGYGASVDFAACDGKVPFNTSYESLLMGVSKRNYIFFTPNIRILFMHSRGSTEYERQVCEHMRGQYLYSLGIVAECIPPDHD